MARPDLHFPGIPKLLSPYYDGRNCMQVKFTALVLILWALETSLSLPRWDGMYGKFDLSLPFPDPQLGRREVSNAPKPRKNPREMWSKVRELS